MIYTEKLASRYLITALEEIDHIAIESQRDSEGED
jgi:hypothetical protein